MDYPELSRSAFMLKTFSILPQAPLTLPKGKGGAEDGGSTILALFSHFFPSLLPEYSHWIIVLCFRFSRGGTTSVLRFGKFIEFWIRGK